MLVLDGAFRFPSNLKLALDTRLLVIVILAFGSTTTQGASQIYRRLLHPYLDRYEINIDSGLEEMRAGATRRIQSLGASAASEIARAVTKQGLTAVGVAFRGWMTSSRNSPSLNPWLSRTPRDCCLMLLCCAQGRQTQCWE